MAETKAKDDKWSGGKTKNLKKYQNTKEQKEHNFKLQTCRIHTHCTLQVSATVPPAL
jgi:hypothetical protein